MKIFLGAFDYYKRHVSVALPYVTPRKLANFALSRLELRLARQRPISTPTYIKIESTPLCHLSCGGCPHRSKDYKKSLSNDMHLNLEGLKKIVTPIEKNLMGVSLSFSGEPLLNRNLPQIVKFLHSRNLSTSFASNLSLPMTSEFAESLVLSGLDNINISLDGMSAETYVKYRKGGNFNLVVANVKKIDAAKKKFKRSRPILTLKMIIFEHNKHEIGKAKSSYRSMGFNRVEFDADHEGPEMAQASGRNNSAMIASKKPCFWPWSAPVVGWDGDVQPCCKQMNRISVGNAVTDNFLDVWRGKAFASLRAGFGPKSYGEGLNDVCRECMGMPVSASAAAVDPFAPGPGFMLSDSLAPILALPQDALIHAEPED
jgi:organic radical activating enzyme